jgi:hypothetical protein
MANYSTNLTTKQVEIKEATIQFWFRFSDPLAYKLNSSNIFKMLNPSKIGNFWVI